MLWAGGGAGARWEVCGYESSGGTEQSVRAGGWCGVGGREWGPLWYDTFLEDTYLEYVLTIQEIFWYDLKFSGPFNDQRSYYMTGFILRIYDQKSVQWELCFILFDMLLNYKFC